MRNEETNEITFDYNDEGYKETSLDALIHCIKLVKYLSDHNEFEMRKVISWDQSKYTIHARMQFNEDTDSLAEKLVLNGLKRAAKANGEIDQEEFRCLPEYDGYEMEVRRIMDSLQYRGKLEKIRPNFVKVAQGDPRSLAKKEEITAEEHSLLTGLTIGAAEAIERASLRRQRAKQSSTETPKVKP